MARLAGFETSSLLLGVIDFLLRIILFAFLSQKEING